MKIYAVKILDISEDKLARLCLLIDSKRRYKIEKFINKEDKIRTLIGEIMIRTIISKELGIKNKYIIFEKNQFGKPYLKGFPKFNFNVSHSSDFVVCGISNKPIGIDIEKVKPIEYREMAKSLFPIDEFNYIIKEDLNAQLDKFYEIWTLKESYIKCCGEGLSIPLKSFHVYINQHEIIKAIINGKCKEHIFKRFNIGLGYKMAVCSLSREISSNIIAIDHNKLVSNFLNLVE